MPVSPTDTTAYATELAAAYADMETILLTRITERLDLTSPDLDRDDWHTTRLAEITALRADLRRALAPHQADALALIADIIGRAYATGATLATGDLPPTTVRRAQRALATLATTVPATVTTATLAAELASTVTATHTRLLTAAETMYRTVITEAVATIGADVSRRAAAQTVLTRLAATGVTGYTDRAGRRWALASYVEAATRSVTSRAALEGYTGRLVEHGYNLVIVSNSPHECSLCRPWEGKVLTITDAPAPEEVRVAGTLRGATAAGLFHVNCTHRTHLYLPGVTRVPTATANPTGDTDRQRLRYLERRLREAKREEVVAVTPAAKTQAAQRIRTRSEDIRAHVASTSAKRQRHREGIGTAR